MSRYDEFVQPRRRGFLLRILADSNDQGCNANLAHELLRRAGYRTATDTFAIDVAWLAEHGFLSKREIGGIVLLRITPSGRDVHRGDRAVPGIEREAD